MTYRITDRCVGCGMCRKICPVDCIAGEPRKRHKVAADRCIDCGACGRICPHGAVLDGEGRPCERVRRRALYWGKPLFDYALCMSCKVCVDACPAACLAVIYTEDPRNKKAYPYLSAPSDCVACRFCMVECPVEAISMKPEADMSDDEKNSLDGPFASGV